MYVVVSFVLYAALYVNECVVSCVLCLVGVQMLYTVLCACVDAYVSCCSWAWFRAYDALVCCECA